MLMDIYEFSVPDPNWDFLKFRVKPATHVFMTLDIDIWGVVDYVEIDYKLKETGRLKTVHVQVDQSKKGYDNLRSTILKILHRYDRNYQVSDTTWLVFKKAFTNAHMHFETKNRNSGNVLLNSNNEYISVDMLSAEARVKEANRAKIIVEVPFKILHHDSYQTTAKLSVTFNLSGPKNYATSGHIEDISNKAIVEWYVNNSLVEASFFKPGLDCEKFVNILSAPRRSFISMCDLIPDFGLDNFCEILRSIYKVFWTTLAAVNRYNYHIEQTSQVKNKSSEFDITFGFGGLIHFDFHEYTGIKACDVCLHNNAYREVRFTENLHFDTTKSEKLFDRKDIEHLLQKFLYLAAYQPELNHDLCELQFIEYLTKDIEDYWKEHLQQPFLDAVFNPRTVEVEIAVQSKPFVESANLTFDPVNIKKFEPENRPPLSDDWILRQLNEFDTRLKVVEGQTKGVNRSCSKMHQAFEDLKKEMIELYHEKDMEFKLVEEVLEKVERKCFPELYSAKPFANWTLKVTAERPKDCTNCADDLENFNCWKCKNYSMWRKKDS